MQVSKDTLTTALGGTMAALTAAQPIINGVQGSMGHTDYIQLVLAVVMSLFGFFTNKTSGNASA